MKLIVGLGNPSKQYEKTRPNIGFMFLDEIAKEHNLTFKLQTKFKGATALLKLDQDYILLKPLTFMNLSGEAVKLVMNYYDIALKDILIIHDELALPTGKLKIKPKGSSGGHNGVQNIIDNLDSEEFARIRIGIDNFKDDIIDYVLGKFSRKEMKLLAPIIEDAPNMISYLDKQGLEKFMSYYNTKYNE